MPWLPASPGPARQMSLHTKQTGIHAFATSAIRSASNGEEFIEKVKHTLGINVEIISGDREAELIYYGVKEAVVLTDEYSLIKVTRTLP